MPLIVTFFDGTRDQLDEELTPAQTRGLGIAKCYISELDGLSQARLLFYFSFFERAQREQSLATYMGTGKGYFVGYFLFYSLKSVSIHSESSISVSILILES